MEFDESIHIKAAKTVLGGITDQVKKTVMDSKIGQVVPHIDTPPIRYGHKIATGFAGMCMRQPRKEIPKLSNIESLSDLYQHYYEAYPHRFDVACVLMALLPVVSMQLKRDVTFNIYIAPYVLSKRLLDRSARRSIQLMLRSGLLSPMSEEAKISWRVWADQEPKKGSNNDVDDSDITVISTQIEGSNVSNSSHNGNQNNQNTNQNQRFWGDWFNKNNSNNQNNQKNPSTNKEGEHKSFFFGLGSKNTNNDEQIEFDNRSSHSGTGSSSNSGQQNVADQNNVIIYTIVDHYRRISDMNRNIFIRLKNLFSNIMESNKYINAAYTKTKYFTINGLSFCSDKVINSTSYSKEICSKMIRYDDPDMYYQIKFSKHDLRRLLQFVTLSYSVPALIFPSQCFFGVNLIAARTQGSLQAGRKIYHPLEELVTMLPSLSSPSLSTESESAPMGTGYITIPSMILGFGLLGVALGSSKN